MFQIIKKYFFTKMMCFGCNLSNENPLECKVRPEILNVNSDEPVVFPYSIKTNKCSGSRNNINDPYGNLCS